MGTQASSLQVLKLLDFPAFASAKLGLPTLLPPPIGGSISK